MPGRLTAQSFGPLTKGVIDRANAALSLQGAARQMRGFMYSGVGKLSVRPGTAVALTLKDDTRAVTAVVATTAASGGSLTSVVDATQTWTVNAYVGKTVEIMSGPGAGQRAVIVSNTATAALVAAWTKVAAWAVAPTASSTYRIVTVTTAAAAINNVIAFSTFGDGALAIGYSSATSKCYLYVLTSTMDGWTDASGTLHAGDLCPEPYGSLWTAMTGVPTVTMTEGLGVAYIAHAQALDENGLYWPTKTFDGTSIATLAADFGDGSGSNPIHFTAVIAFETALWGAGFGVGTAPATAYRPELARFSPPTFQDLGSTPPASGTDDFAVGDRVRSKRERIVGFGIAGQSLYIGGTYILTRVTGFGRDSWYRTPLDRSHGFVGPLCMVTGGQDGDYLYYWSMRGPMRIAESGDPDPLFTAIQDLVSTVINPQNIVASYDDDRDLVIWAVDVGNGTRRRVAYDVSRGVFSSADDDWGLAVSCAGVIDPIVAAKGTAPASAGPDGPPTNAVTSAIGTTVATATWTNGDDNAQTEVYLQASTDANPTLVATLPAGVNTYTFGALFSNTTYSWSVEHLKNGRVSAILGPSVATTFTTTVGFDGLLAPNTLEVDATSGVVNVTWDNAGETDAQTEVWVAGPSATPPTSDQFFLTTTADPGVASATVNIGNVAGARVGTYWVQIRHVRSGSTPSSYDGPVSVYVTQFQPF